MYEPGELIVYGGSGVCRVLAVGAPKTRLADTEKQYYTLQPVYGTEKIFTPVDTPVFMRPVLSRGQAQTLVQEIPAIAEDVCTEKNLGLLREHYEAGMQKHECRELVRIIKSVYVKDRAAAENGRKLGQVDQRYGKRAQELLYGELAVALEIPREDVEQYIADCVETERQSAGA